MINRVVLVGRLTRDPELRTTSTGKNVVEFSIAVNKRIKPSDGSPDADFFRVKAWGSTADYVSNYLTKGRLVGVDGRLDQRRYTDKDGNNREIIEVVAESVQGLDRARDDAAPSGGGGTPAHAAVTGGAAPAADEYDPFADE
ncbi:MAG: single-stranded DNA-binding protein [Fimbriimonadaceae bacterium]